MLFWEVLHKQLKLYFISGFLFLILGISQCAIRNMLLASSPTTEQEGQFAKYKFTQQNVSCSAKEFVRSVSSLHQPAVFLLPVNPYKIDFRLISSSGLSTGNLFGANQYHQSTPALYILYQQLKIAS
ncbi:hypothetical protein [Sphingobacterium hungaricum]|uniref:Uncharacterized protein n=1 Tax=Sphingobacterium hungaricum TaxID=2082723 RepID=A0A928UUS7_9SPHI|nr:hypothetical protein [Sphingobacterium hungaricum]MBE8712233.1 hypothetical protein [Sphingobacterium hungaricum]